MTFAVGFLDFNSCYLWDHPKGRLIESDAGYRMIRFNPKLLFALGLCVLLSCGMGLHYLSDMCYYGPTPAAKGNEDPLQVIQQHYISREEIRYEPIECLINREQRVKCRREGSEVYVPFSFLRKYYEIFGRITSDGDGGESHFEWSHSHSRVYTPKGKYEPRGVFMYFENYNVEIRDRVKCLSATEGVPVSSQWESGGYYYPTQIAQFALAHYSKNLTDVEPRKIVLEDGLNFKANWLSTPGTRQARVMDERKKSHVLEFRTPADGSLSLPVDQLLDLVLTVDVKFFSPNSSLKITLQNKETQELWRLHYTCSNQLIQAHDQDVYHGMGCENLLENAVFGGLEPPSTEWKTLIRDLGIDLQKGISLLTRSKRKIVRSHLKVMSIDLTGIGRIDNVSIASSEHLAHFFHAAHWFVRHQDAKTGGWPSNVKRRVASGMLELEPGWYSAMGQGHALSVLSRAYFLSGGDSQYLETALKALRPFRVPSSKGGVLAMFLGEVPWYEEYPTQPSSFVLNGFIYSLLGLYDLMTIAPSQLAGEASALFTQGMTSLKTLLPLFDTGSGTSYDLRHLALKTAPNLARWDYHATHVNQLLLLSTIDNDPVLTSTAHRWAGYMNGKRASHN